MPSLELSLESKAKFEKFIRSGEYKTVLSDPKLTQILTDIDKKMLVFSAISPDYADGLSEDWSGKSLFADENKGNALIRIHFAMLLK
jgi:hypothetical protein